MRHCVGSNDVVLVPMRIGLWFTWAMDRSQKLTEELVLKSYMYFSASNGFRDGIHVMELLILGE